MRPPRRLNRRHSHNLRHHRIRCCHNLIRHRASRSHCDHHLRGPMNRSSFHCRPYCTRSLRLSPFPSCQRQPRTPLSPAARSGLPRIGPHEEILSTFPPTPARHGTRQRVRRPRQSRSQPSARKPLKASRRIPCQPAGISAGGRIAPRAAARCPREEACRTTARSYASSFRTSRETWRLPWIHRAWAHDAAVGAGCRRRVRPSMSECRQGAGAMPGPPDRKASRGARPAPRER